MKRAEYLYRLNSDNWGDYQVAIRELKYEVSDEIYKISYAYWNMIQELEGTNLKSDKWELNTPKTLWTKELGFHIHFTLSKVTGWSVASGYRDRDDYTIGFGGGSHIPEHAREYSFIRREIIIPNKFVEDFKQ